MLAAVLAAAEVPSLPDALAQLRAYEEGSQAKSIGPIDLRGYNSHRLLSLSHNRRVLIVSTLWGSSIVFVDRSGRVREILEAGEIDQGRTWVADLDGDAALELITDERVGRGTGFQLRMFRVYTVSGHARRLWEAESYRLEAPWTPERVILLEDRRSYLRIRRSPEPHLEYRYLCGKRQCGKRVTVKEGRVIVEDIPVG